MLVIVGYIFQIGFITSLSPVAALWFFIFVLIWGFCLIVLSHLFGVIFKSRVTATVFGFVFVIIQVLGSLALNLLVFPYGEIPSFLYLCIPTITFSRALFIIFQSSLSPALINTTQVTISCFIYLLFLIGGTIILLIISIYLEQVMPRKLGTAKSIFFPIISLYNFIFKKKRNMAPSYNENDILLQSQEQEDRDVINERALVSQNEVQNAALIVDQLCKLYTDNNNETITALKNVSFYINEGECFGILGPNGAGKTTLINIICGVTQATSGSYRFQNLLSFENNSTSTIGYCPQTDVFYDDLTVEEHLLFFSRLRGCPPELENDYVQSIIDEVGLQNEKKKNGKNFKWRSEKTTLNGNSYDRQSNNNIP